MEDGTTTSGSGGGISNYGGTLTVTHSLVAANGTAQSRRLRWHRERRAEHHHHSPAQLTVIDVDDRRQHCRTGRRDHQLERLGQQRPRSPTRRSPATTAGARSTVGGGLLAADGGTISVENSIVAANTVDSPSAGTPSNCGIRTTPGTITSLGHNLESATDCGFTCDRRSPEHGSRIPVRHLATTAGTRNTFALKATSPAVDAIPAGSPDCAGSDQRDVPRPQGSGCDIGAFELFQPVEGQAFTTVVGAVEWNLRLDQLGRRAQRRRRRTDNRRRSRGRTRTPKKASITR